MRHQKYISAHPESVLGDPNEAYKRGWFLVAVQPNGLLWYRRKRFWE